MENVKTFEGNDDYDAVELYDGDSLPLEEFLWKKIDLLESQVRSLMV